MNTDMRSKIKSPQILKIVDRVLEELKDFNPYFYHVSRHNSVYIKFQDSRLRSLRIGDHPGKPKYPYKWNITIGGDTKEKSSNNIMRFHFNEKSIRRFIKRIKQYHRTILQRELDEKHICPIKILPIEK